MICSRTRFAWCLALATFMGLGGCEPYRPARVVPDLPDPSAPDKAMEMYDANHDGLLDAKELEKVPGLKAGIKQVDTDNDGKISREEIADRIRAWADSKVGRMPVRCRVTHGGKPLAGAKVTYLPEPFLGGALLAGSGITSSAGYADISAPYPKDSSIYGLSPGFYRIEITEEGEKIPAKYNTETVLGAEISNGSADINNGMKFDLKY